MWMNEDDREEKQKDSFHGFDCIRNGIVVPHVSVSGSFYHRVAAVLIRLTQGIISCHLFSNFPIKSHFRDCYLKERVETFPPINNPRRSLNFLFSSVLVQFINCIIKTVKLMSLHRRSEVVKWIKEDPWWQILDGAWDRAAPINRGHLLLARVICWIPCHISHPPSDLH